jgi:hypothetical protein
MDFVSKFQRGLLLWVFLSALLFGFSPQAQAQDCQTKLDLLRPKLSALAGNYQTLRALQQSTSAELTTTRLELANSRSYSLQLSETLGFSRLESEELRTQLSASKQDYQTLETKLTEAELYSKNVLQSLALETERYEKELLIWKFTAGGAGALAIFSLGALIFLR